MIDSLKHLDQACLADLLRCGEEDFEADGYSYSSPGPSMAAPVSSSAPGLRTHPEDPIKRPHEKGYPESGIEEAVDARMHDVCDRCEGLGHEPRRDGSVRTCRSCSGTGRRWADPIGDAVRELVIDLYDVVRLVRLVDKRRLVVMHAASRHRGRESSLQGVCCIEACGAIVSGTGNDRLRRGYCRACYYQWTRWTELENNGSSDPGADRIAFARWRTEQLAQEHEGYSVADIPTLQARGELPPQRSAS